MEKKKKEKKEKKKKKKKKKRKGKKEKKRKEKNKLATLDTSALTKTEGVDLAPRRQSPNIQTSKRSPKF
ncbi:uncharacterized protein Bfra_011877 [Botrytis fragariae]|uniref:Uncharacterized protein n=1 Tax=Botrytis fragariae TaxID=1964551 RepID=A0A8H6AJQ3_9HELO|nr:uncharacterized protein Bfra_011877 [Botrytis fragariae]KAF5868912.1 hypothetical protein Bfra_011877 [Botrytis fragariae]